MDWISPDAARTVEARHGDAGRAWLDGLPNLLGGTCDRLGLTPAAPLAGGTTAAVVEAATPGGSRVVLKATFDPDEADTQGRWLAAHPHMAPRVVSLGGGVLVTALLDAPCENGAVPPAEAVDAVTALLGGLAQAPGDVPALDVAHRCGRVLHWVGTHDPGRAGGLQELLTGLAPCLAAEVDASDRWVHGDLHAGNVVVTGGGWCVLDPLPARGPVASDAAYWATDPLRGGGAAARLDALASAGVADRASLGAWAQLCAAMHYGYQLAYGTDRSLDAVALVVLDEVLGGVPAA